MHKPGDKETVIGGLDLRQTLGNSLIIRVPKAACSDMPQKRFLFIRSLCP